MTTTPKKGSDSFAEVTVIDSQYNHFRDYVDIIRVYKCKLCPFCSPLEHVITSHMSEAHFPRRCFLCKQCLFVFESREQLIEHIQAGHGSQALNCSFGEPTSNGSPAHASRLGSTYQDDERTGRKALDDGGVNGQSVTSVTSSTSNLANIPDDPAAVQPHQKDDLPASPGLGQPTESPLQSPVSQTSPPNWCTSSSQEFLGRHHGKPACNSLETVGRHHDKPTCISQETQGRHHEKPNSGQLMGLGVRKMLQRRHSLGGSHPASELHMGFFSNTVKTEPISPKESSTDKQDVQPVIRDITSADSLTDSNERESLSRSSMVSCPDNFRSKECEVIKTLPVQRDVAVVRGIPFRPEQTENVNVKHEHFTPTEDNELKSMEKRGDTTPCENQQDTRDSPKASQGLELGMHLGPDLRTDPPTSLRDIVSHVMEKHRHNNDTVRRPAETPAQRSVALTGHAPPSMEYHGPKPRPRSYSITEGEIPSLHEHQDDALDSSKEGLRSELLGHPTDHKQYGQAGGGPTGHMPLWYPYHQQPHERDQGKYPRIVPWSYHGHFPGVNQSQTSAKIPAQQSSDESVLYRYLLNPHPHMKRRRNSIGVTNPVESNKVGLPWPPQLPPNEATRFGPGAQTHMPWGAMPGYLHAYGLQKIGDKTHSPNSITKHGSQVSPNRFGEYLVDMERKDGNQSNTSDQTSSEGTQDLAQVDDITRQVNSAIRGTGGFYNEQNGGVEDYDGEEDENRSDDGRKRSRKSTFNIYREIPERKRKLDRVEEEKIKKSYNADGSFDYFTLTGWKAYKCDLCKKRRFKTASELEDHKRIKHPGDLNQKSCKLVFHSVHVDDNDLEESI